MPHPAQRRGRSHRPTRRPLLEWLEPRLAPAASLRPEALAILGPGSVGDKAQLRLAMTLTPVAQDGRSPHGDTVASLAQTFLFSGDHLAHRGIALVGAGGAGTW